MNRIGIALGAGVASLALAVGVPAAQASVPLPVVAELGVATVAPVLKKISPAVITISIKGHVTEGGKKRDIRTTGSGVVLRIG